VHLRRVVPPLASEALAADDEDPPEDNDTLRPLIRPAFEDLDTGLLILTNDHGELFVPERSVDADLVKCFRVEPAARHPGFLRVVGLGYSDLDATVQ
jgi:hypothetical protein